MSLSRAMTLISSEPTLAFAATPETRQQKGRLRWFDTYQHTHTHTGTQITCSVLRLSEAWFLVIDVFQFNANLQQAGVTSRVQSFGSCCPLTPGRSPAPVAGSFDDDGVDRDLLPVQVLMQL